MVNDNCEGVEKTLHYLRQRTDIAEGNRDSAGQFSYGQAMRQLQLGNPDPAVRMLNKDRVENRTVKRFVRIITALLDELAAKYGGARIWGDMWPDRQVEIATGKPPAIASNTH